MHPIIEECMSSNNESLSQIFKHLYDRNSPFESTFFEVLTTTDFDARIYHKIDQAVVEGHPDESMYLLFIANAISLMWSHGQTEKVESLISIADLLSFEDIHAVVRALYMQATALPMFAKGQISESMHTMKVAMDLVDTNHPRYKYLLLNYASCLAAGGQLADLSETQWQAFESPSEYENQIILLFKIENHSYVGDYELGFQLAEEIKPKTERDRTGLQEKKDCLKIISSDFNPDHYQDETFKILARVYQNLSKGHLEKSIKHYKVFTQSIDASPGSHMSIVSSYIPIHLALCLGNASEARVLLENSDSYLDDFFLTRILLLERNYTDARFVLRRLVANVEHYGALRRLLFELQFAKELNPSHFLLLMHDWKGLETLDMLKTQKPVVKLKPLKGLELLIGHGQKIQQIRSQIQQYAPLQETVLILGETGTGKELVAKALHQESDSSQEPFLAINCGALTDNLLESELFGYEAGSFTGALKQKKGIFESAGKGTVFLDEFGDISPKLQVSLLRVLESAEIRMIGGSENRKISCRIIVAANNNLEQAVKDKSFREDLYYRLNRLEIYLPPLRERKEDMSELVAYFLSDKEYSSDRQRSVTTDFLNAFTNYNWPGNIRELKNAMDRLKILNPNKDIFDIDDLEFVKFQGDFSLPKKEAPIKNKTFETSEQPELDTTKDSILHAIHQSGLRPAQRIAYMKELFLKYKILTRSQIMSIIKVNPIAATKELQQLCDEGFITRKSPNNSPRSIYFELNTN